MIITISREVGSGGSEIAHKLAKELGIPCYDRSVAQLTATTSGFSKETIEDAEDKVSGSFEYWSGTYSAENLPVYDRIYLAQRETIIDLAKQGDCIIVGRCASHILEEVNISSFDVFVYAPLDERKERISVRNNLDLKQAERWIKRRDEFRKSYYRRYAYADWGNKKNYDLLVNSSMGIEKAVKVIAAACKK